MRITKSVLFQVFVVFILLMLNYISLPMSGGESQYLTFAKQFSNPNWIPNSFSLTEFPGTRFVFQTLFGGILNVLEMDLCALLFRTFNFALIAFPLAFIFKKLELRFFESIFILQIFLTGQSLLGKEWMIGSFEPKTMAYVFFLWAFYFWLKNQRYWLVVMAAIACYFHIVVGGWFLIAVAIMAFWNGNWKEYIKPALLFLLLISPFLVYLIPVLFASDNTVHELTANQIYVYYRLPHHLGIAANWNYFVTKQFGQVLLVLAAFVIGLLFHRKKKVKKSVSQWFLVCFSISIIYVFISLIDGLVLKQAASFGLKFYPFRLNSFGYFLFLIALLQWIKRFEFYKSYTKQLSYFLVTASLIIGLVRFQEGVLKDKHITSDLDYWEMVRNAQELSKPSDVFVLNTKEQSDYFYNNFSRLTNRENFSYYKFVPAEKKKIYQWYDRQVALKDLRYSRMTARKFCSHYSIDFVINQETLEDEQFDLVFENESYFIYKYKSD